MWVKYYNIIFIRIFFIILIFPLSLSSLFSYISSLLPKNFLLPNLYDFNMCFSNIKFPNTTIPQEVETYSTFSHTNGYCYLCSNFKIIPQSNRSNFSALIWWTNFKIANAAAATLYHFLNYRRGDRKRLFEFLHLCKALSL